MGISLGSLIWTALDLVGAAGNEDYNQRLQYVQETSFARLRFEGEDGQWLDGRSMQVLRKCSPGAFWDGVGSDNGDTSAWYCLGPDERLYVAMPVSYRIGLGWRVEWEVLPLPERDLLSHQIRTA